MDAHSMCTKQVLNKQANRHTNKISLQTFYWLEKKLNQSQGPFEYKTKVYFSPAQDVRDDKKKIKRRHDYLFLHCTKHVPSSVSISIAELKCHGTATAFCSEMKTKGTLNEQENRKQLP
jgi:hypothetical protein